ncbi:unnamed protein product [Rhizophagus irregularis]|nr:unnamed protein product [Rhizophagus irregularis]
MVSFSNQEYDFFTNEEKPTPVAFFKKFNCTSKKTAVSRWYSALREILKIYKNDLKLVNIKQNYKGGKYKQAIEDYFKTNVLEKEKVYIDEKLTKKTSKAIRTRIDDLLPEKTDSKKPRLMEPQNDGSKLISADSKINQGPHNSCSSISDDPSSKSNLEEDIEFDTRKRHKILYSWEDAIDQIDFRHTSKKDWIFESYNLSNEFRNFQQLTIQQIRKNPYLCYKKDVQKILCLSNIMLIEQTKPTYFTCDQAVWNTICRRQAPSSLSSLVNSVILEYSTLLNSFTPLDEIEDKWCANFSRITELLNKEDRSNFCKCQIILRNFFLLGSISKNNEDTFVHDALHDLINEIFRDPILELVWANSESSASKNRRSSNKENTVKDYIKLADFQAGTLDELIKKYGNKTGMASFGIWVCGARIRIYEMDLNYDGIYRMFMVANVVIPTERAQFISLVPVLEAFSNIKHRIYEVLTVFVSNTPSNSPSRSTYGRMPIPSPKSVKVAITGLYPN